MKVFFFALTLLVSAASFASESTILKADDEALSGAEAVLVSVAPICPKVPGRMSCMAVGSNIRLSVKFRSCADSLGGYFTKFEVQNGVGVLYFAGIDVHSKKASYVRCARAGSKEVSVTVPFEGKIELVNLDYVGM